EPTGVLRLAFLTHTRKKTNFSGVTKFKAATKIRLLFMRYNSVANSMTAVCKTAESACATWAKSTKNRCSVPGSIGIAVWLCSIRAPRSEEHTSELQSRENLVCRLLLEKKNKN